jgi:hypothetical protein
MKATSGFVNRMKSAVRDVIGSLPATMQHMITNKASIEPNTYITAKAADMSTKGMRGARPMSRARRGSPGRAAFAMGSATTVDDASPTVAMIRGFRVKVRRAGVADVDCERGLDFTRVIL